MTPQKIGRYEIKAELGRGGMAIVYLARDPRTDREVAIKVLPREFLFDPQFHVRFEREIKTVAQLEHPAIVPIHDVGEEEGQPYFVMRYMTGGTLATWLKHGKVSLQDTARIIERLAKALNYAHSRGIIHRDIKPGNILFDSNNEAFISDFGVAKLADAATNMTGSGVIGTPAYMSPEQAQSLNIDGRSDVYALGAIIYEMLTGHQPYKADTPMSVILKHLTEPVPEIMRNFPEFSEEVDAVIKKSMHKDPDQRYGSTIELARALNKAAFGEEGHLTELPITRPLMAPLAEVIANSVAPTIAPNSTPLVTTPPQTSAPQKRSWLGIGLGVLAVIIILSLSAMLFLREEASETVPTPLPPTQTPIIITATPLPATETPIPTATLALTPTPEVLFQPSQWNGTFRWFGSVNPVTFIVDEVKGSKFSGAMYWVFPQCRITERVEGDVIYDIATATEQNRWALHPDFENGDTSGIWLRWTQNESIGSSKCYLTISGDWWYGHINSEGRLVGIHFTNATNAVPDKDATFNFTLTPP